MHKGGDVNGLAKAKWTSKFPPQSQVFHVFSNICLRKCEQLQLEVIEIRKHTKTIPKRNRKRRCLMGIHKNSSYSNFMSNFQGSWWCQWKTWESFCRIAREENLFHVAAHVYDLEASEGREVDWIDPLEQRQFYMTGDSAIVCLLFLLKFHNNTEYRLYSCILWKPRKNGVGIFTKIPAGLTDPANGSENPRVDTYDVLRP